MITYPGRAADPPGADSIDRLSGKRQFARGARAVSRARDFIEDLLTPAVDAGVADDIRVCVSELATNAVRYGPRGRDFLVRVTTRDGTVRVEVHDAGDGAPRVCAPTCDDTRGRGLLVVAALADDWGVSGRDGVGKMVWAEFKARAAAKTPC